MKKLISLLAIVTILSSCAENGVNKQGAGTVLGGIGGALLGSTVGKGSGQMAGIAIGAIAGSLIGNQIGASMDKADRAYAERNSQNALESAPTGRTSQWKNPDNGHSGTFTPIRTFQNNDQYCREYNQTVTIGGKTEKAYGKACREVDGSWRIVS